MPKDSDNPCVKCGQCEKKCTQHLPITAILEDMAGLAESHSYSEAHLLRRISDALDLTTTDSVGLYPTGVYTEAFYIYFKKHFPDRQVYIFDKNTLLWGQEFFGLTIMSPQDIPTYVDTLIITHYLYQDAIYRELSPLEEKGVHLVKLHKDGDIPYFC
jgi:hypothetical protein